ncbi:hypothetical protein EDD85DRAFT_130438 [Armillaria nabsnona]|nr:hypothetical protein EDD85DRAFT_130438 [Armillaria nabsnona]
MSYTLPNRASISCTTELRLYLDTLEVDGIAIVGTSNGHAYHFQVFIYNCALGCSLSFDCKPTYEAPDPDKACVAVGFNTYTWTKSRSALPGEIPPSTGPFNARFQTSTKVWKICDALFDNLKRDRYRFNSGMGCRHWCATILSDLEAHGYVSSGTAMNFESWEQAKYIELGAAVFFLPRIQGDFYD